MPWVNLGPSGSLIPFNDPIAIKDSVSSLEIYIGQQDGVAFVTPTTSHGPWTNWTGAGGPVVGGGAESDAINLAVAQDSDHRIELYAVASDGNVWFT
jgi:hypothetical protein